MPAGTVIRHKPKQPEAQERVLGYLRQGDSIAIAMKKVRRSQQAYSLWKKTSQSFARRAETILMQQGRAKVTDAAIANELSIGSGLIDWRRHYFGYETFWHQQKILEAMEQAGPDTVTMVLLPPGWGKTSCEEDFLCKEVAEDKNVRVLLISEGVGLAAKILGNCARRMTNDTGRFDDYVTDYGPFKMGGKNQTWNANMIRVLGVTRDQRDPTIECRGAGSKIYGARCDILVLDDIQSRQNLSGTKELLALYRQDWKSRPLKNGRTFIIGTRVGQGDFYEELLKLGIVDTLVQIPALDDQGKSNFPPVIDEHGERVIGDNGDPLGWSEAELEKKRMEVGTEIWERVYMQQSGTGAASTFRLEELRKNFDEDREPGNRNHGWAGLDRIGGLDPALGGYAGYVICSYDSEHLYIEDLRNEPNLSRNEDLFAILEEMTQLHQPSSWIIEKNNMQGGLARDDRLMALRDQYGFYVVEHFTGSNKMDESIGIRSMAGAFLRGEIRFPGAGYGHELMQPLIDELLAWRWDIPTKKLRQDLVMALWFCYLRWLDLRGGFTMSTDRWNRSGLSTPMEFTPTLGGWR